MPKLCRYFIFSAFALLLGFFEVSGQDKKLISGEFQGMNFEQFVLAVESKTDYHFYYNVAQFDSLTVNISVTNKSLNAILDAIFLNTEFHYAIDAQNNVFVIRRYKIETQ